jgi:hypothetical protein
VNPGGEEIRTVSEQDTATQSRDAFATEGDTGFKKCRISADPTENRQVAGGFEPLAARLFLRNVSIQAITSPTAPLGKSMTEGMKRVPRKSGQAAPIAPERRLSR